MAKAKFDQELDRMSYLMEFKSSNGPSSLTNIEYHVKGADGNIYGILKEGNTYFIKTTTPDKELVSESYKYINGFMNRFENAFKSYNEATKQLELKLMSLNEAFGKKEDISVYDFNRGEKILSQLTEEARKEINRVQQIVENSCNIGNHGDPESKGKSNPCNTEKNNDPFSIKTDAKLDKDLKETNNDPKKANADYKNVASVDNKLQNADKMEKGGEELDNYERVKDDLDGEGVASQDKKEGKVVKMNEEFEDIEAVEDFEEAPEVEDSFEDINADVVAEPETLDDEQIIGIGDEGEDETDLDDLLEEFETLLSGDNETLTGPHGDLETQTDEWLETEGTDNADEKQEALDGPEGNGEHIATDTLDEAAERVSGMVVDKLMLENFKKAVDKIVREEVTNLNIWGKHPKYGKQPMTTPPNKEVLAGTADRDWNDDSAKGSEVYGKKIGNGAPFDILVDEVMKRLKESIGLKKN